MPAQPLLIAAAGGDEVLAVVDQQADVKRGAVEVSAGELLDSFLERGAGDCEGVDRVRLAPLARGAPGAGDVLGATRTIRSPRAIRNRSSAPETCRQSSIAHTRSASSVRAHRSSFPNASLRAGRLARRARRR